MKRKRWSRRRIRERIRNRMEKEKVQENLKEKDKGTKKEILFSFLWLLTTWFGVAVPATFINSLIRCLRQSLDTVLNNCTVTSKAKGVQFDKMST